MNNSRNLLILVLMLISLALLYPGVTQPVMTLTGTIDKSELVDLGVNLLAGGSQGGQGHQMLTALSQLLGLNQIEGQILVYDTTRSIWGTVEELARTGNPVVALLIVTFSLVIPVFKLLLQGLALLLPATGVRGPVLQLNAVLSKWSMADVFVMALLVSYMAGSASEQMGDMLTMDAQLETGFWYFLTYCLFSIAASGLARRAAPA